MLRSLKPRSVKMSEPYSMGINRGIEKEPAC